MSIPRCIFLTWGIVAVQAALFGAVATHGKEPRWEIIGQLSEACSCSVPCGCNFGEGASPHHYCWSMMSLDIRRGHYDKVILDGLHLAGAKGKKSLVWYIDDRATPEQKAALKAIANHVLPSKPNGKRRIYFQTAQVIQVIGNKSQRLQIGTYGGFEADYIIGMDGKTPIVVENMQSWNVQHDVKAKTKKLYYRDQFGNKYNLKDTNSNMGRFDWTDETPAYF